MLCGFDMPCATDQSGRGSQAQGVGQELTGEMSDATTQPRPSVARLAVLARQKSVDGRGQFEGDNRRHEHKKFPFGATVVKNGKRPC